MTFVGSCIQEASHTSRTTECKDAPTYSNSIGKSELSFVAIAPSLNCYVTGIFIRNNIEFICNIAANIHVDM